MSGLGAWQLANEVGDVGDGGKISEKSRVNEDV